MRSRGKLLLVLLVYAGLIVLLTSLMLLTTGPSLSPAAATTLEQDLRDRSAAEVFSVLHNDDATAATSRRVERRREIQKSLLGPLVPVNCNTTRRLCLRSENCRLFCKDSAVVAFECEQGVCVERAHDDVVDGAKVEMSSNCDTKNGEFGLLVGYSELGVAQWECVQLYPGWENRSRYCENGTVELDTRVRTPSYKDCVCPADTQRMVYERSVLGQTVYGLPHCVPDRLVKFYSLSYRVM